MEYDRPPASIPATPEYVLSVLRDWYRQECSAEYDGEPEIELTFETTIEDWQDYCELLDWRQLGRALDSEWKLGVPDSAWRTVLTPAWSRTLGDLCEFVARKAVRPSIEPVRILGTSCLAAGAFAAIRSLLRDAGVNVDSVAPSTALEPYTRSHLDVFLGPISRLAPNAIPAVKVSRPLDDLSHFAFVLGMVLTFAGAIHSPLATIPGLVLLLVSWISAGISSHVRAAKVTLGGLQTFRDLARVIADGGEGP